MQLHLIDNCYLSLEKNDRLPIELGMLDAITLDTASKAPHQLKITINQKAKDLYDFFLANPYCGIRIDQADGLSLAFIKKPQNIKDTESATGSLTINFLSTVALLTNTRVYTRKIPIGGFFAGNSDEYFRQITDKIIINYISTPKRISTLTNVGDAYDLLVDGADRLDIGTWVDLGIDNASGKVKIEVGDVRQKPVDKNLIATNQIDASVIDENFIFIEEMQKVSSGEELTHLRVIVDQGNGGDLSSSLLFDSNTIRRIVTQEGFPFVPSKEQLANRRILYDILNEQYQSDIEVCEVYDVSGSGDIQGGVGTLNVAQFQYAYTRAVNFLRTKAQNARFNAKLVPNKIILPSTKVRVNFRAEQMNGAVFSVDEVQTIGNITYTKEDFERFLQ